MKRIVNYRKVNDKYEVIYISNPITDDIANKMILDRDNCGLIDGDFDYPPTLDNKCIKLYFNKETNTIEYEYIDVDFELLPTSKKLKILKKENEDLKSELFLTQQALFELDAYISGDEIPPYDDDSDDNINPNDDEEEASDDESEIPEVPFDLANEVENAIDGDIIVLTSDVELEHELIINKVLTINLNNYTITSPENVFTVRSSKAYLTILGAGRIIPGDGGNYRAIYASSGVVTIKEGTCIGSKNAEELGNDCIYACGSAIINIDGGTFSAELNGEKYPVLNVKDDLHGVINVTGGTFKNYNPAEHEEINMNSDMYKVVQINDNTWMVEQKTAEDYEHEANTEPEQEDEEMPSEDNEDNNNEIINE